MLGIFSKLEKADYSMSEQWPRKSLSLMTSLPSGGVASTRTVKVTGGMNSAPTTLAVISSVPPCAPDSYNGDIARPFTSVSTVAEGGGGGGPEAHGGGREERR